MPPLSVHFYGIVGCDRSPGAVELTVAIDAPVLVVSVRRTPATTGTSSRFVIIPLGRTSTSTDTQTSVIGQALSTVVASTSRPSSLPRRRTANAHYSKSRSSHGRAHHVACRVEHCGALRALELIPRRYIAAARRRSGAANSWTARRSSISSLCRPADSLLNASWPGPATPFPPIFSTATPSLCPCSS